MKPTVMCELRETPVVGERTVVHRTSEHPILGSPNCGITHTSRVLKVDYVEGVIETLNTLYKFK